ncbi:MAG: hypothetical protein SVR08_15405 [Spirochaetota bacterium]|nr:hypothetical protein [Spirochaetota bacterium]
MKLKRECALICHRCFIIFSLILFAGFIGCSSQPIKEASGKQKDKPVEQKPDPTTPKIAFIPFDFTKATGITKSKQALSAVAASMMKRESFQPFSIKNWMDKVYKRKALNIFEIIKGIKKSGIKIDYLCHGKIMQSGSKYGLILSLYSVKKKNIYSYYYRSFPKFKSIDKAANDIVVEMEKRLNSSNRSPYFPKSIFINNFNINFYAQSTLDKGKKKIISLDQLEIDKVIYNKNDHFFNEILLYNFHITRLFDVWNSNISNYIRKKPDIPSNIDYIISTNIDISKEFSKLIFKVKSKRRRRNILHYEYPLDNLNIDTLYSSMMENVKIIILSLLDTNERNQIGIVRMEKKFYSEPIFCEDFYISNREINDFILPAKTTNFTISSEKYKMFIYPFKLNMKIFKLEEYYLY